MHAGNLVFSLDIHLILWRYRRTVLETTSNDGRLPESQWLFLCPLMGYDSFIAGCDRYVQAVRLKAVNSFVWLVSTPGILYV